jgi:hypothetical protein
VKVGDLVRVKMPMVVPYIGIATAINVKGGALVHSLDGNYEYWVYDWSGEVINESR